MSNQTLNNNLNYLIDTTFTNVNKRSKRSSFSNYYVPTIEIKDFNVLIDGKQFFEIAVKNEEEAYEQIVELSKNKDYTTGNFLNYEYFKDHYQLIAKDLNKQVELENLDLKQQISFLRKLEENNATMLFIIEKKEETTFDFSQSSVTVV